MYSQDEPDPARYFGSTEVQRKANWKLQQLCRQVERAASLGIGGDCESDALVEAAVAEVLPAPDSRRLMVVVVLLGERSAERREDARAALARAAGGLRQEIARSIHRKRVPELVFDVRWEEEVGRG